MIDSDRLAIAAHLHVLLRRKAGRVTDMEWLARNAEYAGEIIRFARSKALEDNVPELEELAARLEQAMVPGGRSTPGISAPVPASSTPATGPNAAPSGQVASDREHSRYVGGLR